MFRALNSFWISQGVEFKAVKLAIFQGSFQRQFAIVNLFGGSTSCSENHSENFVMFSHRFLAIETLRNIFFGHDLKNRGKSLDMRIQFFQSRIDDVRESQLIVSSVTSSRRNKLLSSFIRLWAGKLNQISSLSENLNFEISAWKLYRIEHQISWLLCIATNFHLQSLLIKLKSITWKQVKCKGLVIDY